MKTLLMTDRSKIWLGLAAVFAAGALFGNAAWVYYYNEIDQRHVQQINDLTVRYSEKFEAQERSHKRAMGEMRNRVEKKVDKVLEKLDQMPPSPIIINAKREIESVKNEP